MIERARVSHTGRRTARGLRMAAAGLAALGLAALGLAACANGPGEGVGAVLGGTAGGLAGAQIGSGDGQLVATGIGAGLGALAGAAVGRTVDRQAAAEPGPKVVRSPAYGPRRTVFVRPRRTPVADVHRQVAIPGAEQHDDIGVFDFLLPAPKPHFPAPVQQVAAPATDPACRRSDAPTLEPVYLCSSGAARYVLQ
jgi:hypothetical protein